MNQLMNTLKLNECEAEIDTRSTRSMDAKITLGIIAIEFKGDNIKIAINPKDREINKSRVVEIERIVHQFQGTKITADSIKELTNKILPIAVRMYKSY
ncbi:hypothetical protein ACX818_001359 [Acinetobacter baumannii]